MSRTLIAGPYTFTGSDSTAIAADTTNWTEQNGSSGTNRILSNSLRGALGVPGDNSWKGAGTFTDDQYAEIKLVGTLSGAADDYVGINLRNNGGAYGANTMYRVFWGSFFGAGHSGAQVYKVVNGNNTNVGTQMGTDILFSAVTNDLLSAEAVANGGNVDINVYLNGVLQGTRTDTSSVITGGKPGVTGSANLTTVRGDDWTAGNITAPSGGFLTRNLWWDNL
jgi:hypothetical protein